MAGGEFSVSFRKRVYPRPTRASNWCLRLHALQRFEDCLPPVPEGLQVTRPNGTVHRLRVSWAFPAFVRAAELVLQVAEAQDVERVLSVGLQPDKDTHEIRVGQSPLPAHVLDATNELNPQELLYVELPRGPVGRLHLYGDSTSLLVHSEQVEDGNVTSEWRRDKAPPTELRSREVLANLPSELSAPASGYDSTPPVPPAVDSVPHLLAASSRYSMSSPSAAPAPATDYSAAIGFKEQSG